MTAGADYERARKGQLPDGTEVGKRAALMAWLESHGEQYEGLSWCDSCLDVLLPVASVCEACGNVQAKRSKAATWSTEARSFTETPASAWDQLLKPKKRG